MIWDFSILAFDTHFWGRTGEKKKRERGGKGRRKEKVGFVVHVGKMGRQGKKMKSTASRTYTQAAAADTKGGKRDGEVGGKKEIFVK